MKQPNKKDIMKKWSNILGSMGMTGSQLDNLSQLAENQSNQILEETKTEDFPSLYTCITALASLDMQVKVYSQSAVKGATSYSFKIYHDKNV